MFELYFIYILFFFYKPVPLAEMQSNFDFGIRVPKGIILLHVSLWYLNSKTHSTLQIYCLKHKNVSKKWQ